MHGVHKMYTNTNSSEGKTGNFEVCGLGAVEGAGAITGGGKDHGFG